MATKSRLGKGLGALFPSLPGEPQHQEHAAPAAAAKEVKASKTDEHVESKSASATAQASVNAVQGMKHAVSRETTKKNQHRRASMPSISLNESAHPADMFFGSTAQPASEQGEQQGSVSRETTPTEHKKDEPELLPVQGGYLVELRLSDVGPNLHQPRTIFDEDDLRELAESIKEVGVLQPIVVRKRQAGESSKSDVSRETSQRYELIMGERRWRASQLAQLKTIPAIVKTTSDDEMLRDALLENLHRVALNPLEEAAAYQQMIDDFGLTQAELSKSISKSRPQIANTLRLLNLPASVQKKVAAGVLSAGHARALLGLNDESEIDKLATRIIGEGLSVRSTEEIVALKNAESNVPKKVRPTKNNPWAGSPIVNNLENHFDTKVSIKGTQKHGRIEIVFSSPEDMERILSMLIPTAVEGAAAKWV
jgi:ParB family chromosome partitioning protein